jgi:hypothetical protein
MLYSLTEETTSSGKVGTEQVTFVKEIEAEYTWDVRAARPDGAGEVELSMKRAAFTMKRGAEDSATYATSDGSPPDGPLRLTAGLHFALASQPLLMEVSPDGHIQKVLPSDELRKSVESMLGKSLVDTALSPATMEHVCGMSIHALPDRALAVGDAWEGTTRPSVPGPVQPTIKVQSRYAGRQSWGERTADRFTIKLEATLPSFVIPDAIHYTITRQSSSGTLLFDPNQGCILQLDTDMSFTRRAEFKQSRLDENIRNVTRLKLSTAATP